MKEKQIVKDNKLISEKNKRKTLIISIVIILLIIVTYLLSRYGWRIKGLKGGSDTTTIAVLDVIKREDELIVRGLNLDKTQKFDGYVYEMKDNTLFLGLRYNKIYGSNSYFDIKIKTNENIEKIILKSHMGEAYAWPLDKADEYFETTWDEEQKRRENYTSKKQKA